LEDIRELRVVIKNWTAQQPQNTKFDFQRTKQRNSTAARATLFILRNPLINNRIPITILDKKAGQHGLATQQYC
jgi:hypothetical protein